MKRFTLNAAAFVTALATTTVAAETELVLTTIFEPSHFIHQELTRWAGEVEAVTEGRVTVIIPAGSLAPPPQQYSAVTSGIADISLSANIFLQRKEPLIEFSMLPFLVNDPEAASVAMWNLYESELADTGMFQDAHVLSLFQVGGGQGYTTDETPLQSVEELGDRKLWALPGAAADLVVELGLSPVTTPAVQVSEVVTSGVVSGIFGLNFESAVDFRISSYLKSATVFPFSTSSVSFTFIMNSDKWDSLSEEDQAAIMAISSAVLAQKAGAAAQRAYDDARSYMEGEGIVFHEADATFFAELQAAGEKQYEDFHAVAAKRGIDGPALIENFKAAMDAFASQR